MVEIAEDTMRAYVREELWPEIKAVSRIGGGAKAECGRIVVMITPTLHGYSVGVSKVSKDGLRVVPVDRTYLEFNHVRNRGGSR